jgi:hypothetical protein
VSDSLILGMPLALGEDDELADAQPLAALVVVKCLAADGSIAYCARSTEGVQTVEALGMARYAVLKLEQAIWQRGDDE